MYTEPNWTTRLLSQKFPKFYLHTTEPAPNVCRNMVNFRHTNHINVSMLLCTPTLLIRRRQQVFSFQLPFLGVGGNFRKCIDETTNESQDDGRYTPECNGSSEENETGNSNRKLIQCPNHGVCR